MLGVITSYSIHYTKLYDRPVNLTNLILQNSYILILAIGMLLAILTGNIDLSVGSVVAFVGAISATLMVDHGIPSVYAMVIALLIGGVIGAWQGYWIAYVKIPAFIVTVITSYSIHYTKLYDQATQPLHCVR